MRRSTLADANERRDWRIYADFSQRLIVQARALYADELLATELHETAYALDSTTIDLCLSMFPWATFRTTKPVDFQRLYALHQAGAFFVTRATKNVRFHRLYSAATDRTLGVIADQTVALDGVRTKRHYPDRLRRIRYRDPQSDNTLVFITNRTGLDAVTVCGLYQNRWQVELFFKWVKQHLRVKRFLGVSENAVKSQLCIAVSVYLLVAILRKRLGIDTPLYPMLQILSVMPFEQAPLYEALTMTDYRSEPDPSAKQLPVTRLMTGQ